MSAKPTNGHVKMSKAEFAKEHRHLPKVLRSGSKSEREEEAREQAGELKDVNESSEGENDLMSQIRRKVGGGKR